MRRSRRFAVAPLSLLALFSAGSALAQIPDPIPEPIEQGGRPVRLETVAAGLTAPNWGTYAPGDDADRLFVVDQPGILWSIDLAAGTRSVFLDVSSRLVPLGAFGPGSFDERGFLGVAFHPDYPSNGLLYTFTSQPVAGPADYTTLPAGAAPNCQTVITEWRVPLPGDPASVVDPASSRELLRIDKPQFNHNGGALTFGPDGMLYISLGDGGRADDQGTGHSAIGNGQDTANPLGAILRIDPQGTNAPNGKYGIPADNPFAGETGHAQEIWAYGFRNPFRISFDELTGELYAADVGQNQIEEIDLVERGGNYGWRHKEGSFFFDPNGDGPGFVTLVDPGVPPGLVDPIAEYDHDEGIAVVGGFVYRGSALPSLRGRYVFGEFARTFSNDGRLFYLEGGDDEIVELVLADGGPLGLAVLGFGQDRGGEIYVLANGTGTPFGSTGVVLRLAPQNPPRGVGPHFHDELSDERRSLGRSIVVPEARR